MRDKYLLCCIAAGCASQAPGRQHHCLTSTRCCLKNRFHSAQQRNRGVARRGRAFGSQDDYGVSFVEIQISQGGRRKAAQYALEIRRSTGSHSVACTAIHFSTLRSSVWWAALGARGCRGFLPRLTRCRTRTSASAGTLEPHGETL